MPDQPFVSVVTPVYNGGPFLAECIESVLRQGHTNFEYVILDNASRDETPEIAARYARADGRVRLLRNDSVLSLVDNWNRAMAAISDRSLYCKFLPGDDLLYPNCLEKMVDVFERHPNVGIVGSLRLRGEYLGHGHIECDGLPPEREVFSGVEVTRLFLRQEVFSLAPTAGMIRCDLIRNQVPFFPAQYLHTDLAAYLNLLDKTDFGFVHDVLFFSRVHGKSVTATVADTRQTQIREWYFLLQDYGPRYFQPAELERLEQSHLRRWYRILLRGLLTRKGSGFVDYHVAGLRQAGHAPTAFTIARAAADEIAAVVSHPGKMYRYLHGRMRYLDDAVVTGAVAGSTLSELDQPMSTNGKP